MNTCPSQTLFIEVVEMYNPNDLMVSAWFITSLCFVLIPRNMYFITGAFAVYAVFSYIHDLYKNTNDGFVQDLSSLHIIFILCTLILWCSWKAFGRALN
jgi:bacteriorhodopsin